MTDQKGIKLGTRRRISNDEIENEEISIISENFPRQRTLLLTPKDGLLQSGKKIDIVIAEDVLLSTAHHVALDTSRESGGFLLGNRYECPNSQQQYVVIDQFMKADYTEGTQVSLTFTAESWAQLKDRLDGKYRGKHLVGWYHSHPGMGIFLSNYDLDIHRNRFANDWNVALVIDPIKQEGGFFGWVDGQINPREKVEFYEMLENDSRETVVAWTNYTAEDPKTGLPAALKSVNTQNFDGTMPASKPPTSSKSTSGGGIFKNPLVLIGGATVLVFFFLASLLLGYWFLKGRGGVAENNTNSVTSTENNKVLDADRTRIPKKDLKGWVSGDNKLRIEMSVNGIGTPDVIQEIKSTPQNLSVTLNSQPTIIEESNVENGAVLKLRTISDISTETVESFKTGKSQDLELVLEIFYNGDVVSREIKTKFRKGSGNSSLGDVIEFEGDFVERKVTPIRTKPPSPVVEKPPIETKPSTPEKPKSERTRSTTIPTQPERQGGTGGIKVDVDVKTPQPQTNKTPKPSPTAKKNKVGGANQQRIDQD